MKCEACRTQKRTSQQNRSMHKYFQLVSDEAKNTGSTFSDFIRNRPKMEMPWTPQRVKEMWKAAAMHMYGVDSTTKLTTKQIDQVYDVVNKVLGEELNIHIPFPSKDNLNEYENIT